MYFFFVPGTFVIAEQTLETGMAGGEAGPRHQITPRTGRVGLRWIPRHGTRAAREAGGREEREQRIQRRRLQYKWHGDYRHILRGP